MLYHLEEMIIIQQKQLLETRLLEIQEHFLTRDKELDLETDPINTITELNFYGIT